METERAMKAERAAQAAEKARLRAEKAIAARKTAVVAPQPEEKTEETTLNRKQRKLL